MKFKVTRILPHKYICKDEENNYYECVKSGNMKKNKIYVGDDVGITFSSNTYVINNIYNRLNSMIRPPVANIDRMIICIALKEPEPDYLLLDKQIILCEKNNILPIICITKSDLKDDVNLNYILNVYKNYEIIVTSSYENYMIDELYNNYLKGYTSAFSGNSGVGKSSIVSKIIEKYKLNNESENLLIGELSSKNNKGKNTTKEVSLFPLLSNTYILDTPGFSSYDLFDIKCEELKKYYNEFNDYPCKYLDCSHINEEENVCNIKKAVKNNLIDILRYERYVYIFNEIKQKENLKYK